MTGDVAGRILQENAGRDPERLRRKYALMRDNPFSFFRATAHLFFDAWPVGSTLDAAPLAWCCGDLHLENFGTFLGDNRLTYFDLNDFDEAALAPATCDITRLLTSLLVAGGPMHLSQETTAQLMDAFLAGYFGTLHGGRARWVERGTARGMIRELLRGLKRRKRRDLLAKRTERTRGGRRRLRVDGEYALPATPEEHERVSDLVHAYAPAHPEPAFFEVLDVARRIAGTASLGGERYVVLVEGRGSPQGNFLLDLKRARPSVLASRLPVPPYEWPSEAARVVGVQRQAQAAAPALLAALGEANASFVLRELQPREDRLRFDPGDERPRRLRNVLHAMGMLAASAHLRTGGWHGAAIADEWMEFGGRTGPQQAITDHAREAAARNQADWLEFGAAYDAGAFTT